jgi:hypothetical protein
MSEGAEERHSPLAMSADEFRLLGHQTVDKVADFLESLARRPGYNCDFSV